MISYFKSFGPSHLVVTRREQIRASLGSFFAIAITAGFCALSTLVWSEGIALLAPIGASAVLLFALPASPLAQPWSVVMGNSVSAVIGVAVARYVPVPVLAEALAVSLAIAAMILCRCLHPPGGAAALTAVIGPPALKAIGFGLAFGPILLGSLVLVAAALIYHPLTGHAYPHRPAAPAKPLTPQDITPADAKQALEKHGEIVDIDPEDLADLLHEAEVQSRHRDEDKKS